MVMAEVPWFEIDRLMEEAFQGSTDRGVMRPIVAPMARQPAFAIAPPPASQVRSIVCERSEHR